MLKEAVSKIQTLRPMIVHGQQEQEEGAEEKNFYQRLGGQSGIEQVIQRVFALVRENEEVYRVYKDMKSLKALRDIKEKSRWVPGQQEQAEDQSNANE